MTEDKIINRVATSALVTLDLEQYYVQGERVEFDIAPQLFQGLILKEKDFRDFIKNNDWSQYQDKLVAVYCSADAVIPTWAYMLLSVALQPFARKIVFGKPEELERALFQEALSNIDWSSFKDAKVVIKGCSKLEVPVSAYVEATFILRGIAASIMFGEPCSTVPVFKRPSKQ
jgi:hypothetical protein